MTRGNATSTSPSAGAAGRSNNKATGSPGTSNAMGAFASCASGSTPTENLTVSQCRNSADFSHSLTGSILSGCVTPRPDIRGVRTLLTTPESDVRPTDKGLYATPSLGLLAAVCREYAPFPQNIIGNSSRIRTPTVSSGVAA